MLGLLSALMDAPGKSSTVRQNGRVLSSFRSGRAAVAAAITVLAVTLALVPGVANASVAPARSASTVLTVPTAVDMSRFDPGNIISDALFFDDTTMSERDVQTFLNARGGTCTSGYTCLRDYRMSTVSKAADSYCSGYSGEANESAARIIAKVAASCGINPQVLLVTLQKEQALVLDTEPSSGQYKFAMGQGCPDTAACDSRYYGFQNQVYGAARQFQIYAEGRYFTWYAPGRTWNILYHPDGSRGCGSSPVYIANKATAGLYYYTPYQPNRAALAAGSGEGDRCSSYGNRNFFRFFTDWFGTTGSPAGSLVQARGDSAVYLVSGTTRHHVRSWDDLTAFRSRLGGVVSVAPDFMQGMTTGKPATRYVHDPASGTLFLLEADGTKHRFPNTASVASFGYAFDDYIDANRALVTAYVTGDDVGRVFRAGSAPETYLLEGSTRRLIADPPAWRAATAGRSAYVATMRPDAATALAAGATYFEPNTLVRGRTSGDVLLTTPTATVVRVPSFALAAEFGATRYEVVDDALLVRSKLASTSLTPAIRCGGRAFIAADGALRSLSGNSAGLGGLSLPAESCAAIPVRAAGVVAPLFVQPRGGGDVYLVEASKLRYVPTYAQLSALNGARPLTLLTWSIDTIRAQGFGTPVLTPGSFVQFTESPEVHRFDDGKLRLVADFDTLIDLGGGSIPPITRLRAEHRASFAVGAPLGTAPRLTERDVIQFSGDSKVYLYANGKLRHVSDWNTLLVIGRGAPPAIRPVAAAFASAYAVGPAVSGAVVLRAGQVVQFAGSGEVFVESDLGLRHVPDYQALVELGGGSQPVITLLPSASKEAYRIGPPLR